MRIFREVSQAAYHYYVQDSEVTVLWYPKMTWISQEVETVRGRLLAEGTLAEVLMDLRDTLPPDLLSEFRRYYDAPGADRLASWSDT